MHHIAPVLTTTAAGPGTAASDAVGALTVRHRLDTPVHSRGDA